MSYVFTQAANTEAIAECEWGQAVQIMFTGFSSCIGIMGIVGGQIIAVHLPLRDATAQATNADVDAAIALLGAAAQPVVIGHIGLWETTIPAVYQHLVDTLHPVEQYAYGDGTYGGEIVNGSIQPRY